MRTMLGSSPACGSRGRLSICCVRTVTSGSPGAGCRHPVPVRWRHSDSRLTSPRFHRADKIGEPLAGLVRVAALEGLEARDPVDAEIAEVCSPFAPGADGPCAAPVVERERPDVALARLSARVAIVQAQHAARADR